MRRLSSGTHAVKSANSVKSARSSCSRSGSLAGGGAAAFFLGFSPLLAVVLFEAGGGFGGDAVGSISRAAESRLISAVPQIELVCGPPEQAAAGPAPG